MRLTRTYTQRGETLVGEIDTDPTPMAADDLDDIDEGQRAHWRKIREAAIEAHDEDRAFRYAVAAGDVWDCETLAGLAAVTRRERASVGARWPEDR